MWSSFVFVEGGGANACGTLKNSFDDSWFLSQLTLHVHAVHAVWCVQIKISKSACTLVYRQNDNTYHLTGSDTVKKLNIFVDVNKEKLNN